MRKNQRLITAGQVIDTIGSRAFMVLTGRVKQQVSNYRASGHLPSDTFLIVTKELERLGFAAAPAIWGIAEPMRIGPAKTRASA